MGTLDAHESGDRSPLGWGDGVMAVGVDLHRLTASGCSVSMPDRRSESQHNKKEGCALLP